MRDWIFNMTNRKLQQLQQLCKCCVLAQFTTDAVQIYVKKANGFLPLELQSLNGKHSVIICPHDLYLFAYRAGIYNRI